MSRFIHWLAIRLTWGPRCPDFIEGCCVCERWFEHDWIFANTTRLDMAHIAASALHEVHDYE